MWNSPSLGCSSNELMLLISLKQSEQNVCLARSQSEAYELLFCKDSIGVYYAGKNPVKNQESGGTNAFILLI